jgi:hypothetical protein
MLSITVIKIHVLISLTHLLSRGKLAQDNREQMVGATLSVALWSDPCGHL